MNTELYELLGVAQDAKPAEIKAAYRKLARTAHPDVGGDEEAFVALTLAYNTLMDPELRKAYDLSGEIRNENPINIQNRLILNLADLLEHVLILVANQGADLDALDVVASMKNVAYTKLSEFMGEISRCTKTIEGMQRVRKRIKRKKEGRNIFVEAIDVRILEEAKKLKEQNSFKRDYDRVLEELNNCESVSTLIRNVQAGMYPGEGVMTDHGTNKNGVFPRWITYG